MKKWIVLLILLLFMGVAKAENISLEIVLNDIVYTNTHYNKLFKIRNLEYPDINGINITFYYNISSEWLYYENYTFIDGLNSYKEANTGIFNVNTTGNYSLCGWIRNFSVCKNISAIDEKSINCDLSIDIETEKAVYGDDESIKFDHIINNDSFDYTIDYSVSDVFGNILRDRSTTNDNVKSFTKDIKQPLEAYIIKSIIYPKCNDTNISNNIAEKLVVVKDTNPIIEKEKPKKEAKKAETKAASKKNTTKKETKPKTTKKAKTSTKKTKNTTTAAKTKQAEPKYELPKLECVNKIEKIQSNSLIYESSSMRIKKLVYYFVLIVMAGIIIAVLFDRNI